MSKRTDRESRLMHSCISKRPFPTKQEAHFAMVQLMVNKGELDERLHVYECDFANHFHFGHNCRYSKEAK